MLTRKDPMTKASKTLLITLLALEITSCSTKKDFISLAPDLKQEIKLTEGYLEEAQKKAMSDVERSNVTSITGGGLIFALLDGAIEGHRRNNAEEAMELVQKNFHTANLQKIHEEKFNELLKAHEWLHISSLTYKPELQDDLVQEIVNQSKADVVLTSKVIYKFNPTMDILTGTLYLTLYPSGEKMKKKLDTNNPFKEPILKINLSSSDSIVKSDEEETMENNLKVWSKDNNARLNQGLMEIANSLFKKADLVLKNPSSFKDQ